ncbi:MAG: DUF2441 domain-containing protein [Candidatus Thermoplasmatota archaeon]|nr:DUF2441 domain-containing protein [Candidatus Thermoplasmatota archaeon]
MEAVDVSKKYYTVDRANTLKEGHILDLTRFDNLEPPICQSHLDTLFPNGVTRHGDLYICNGDAAATLIAPEIELLFEYVRRSFFPHCWSRFQSIFACETIEEARKFRDEYSILSDGQPQKFGTIWEIEAEDAFKADMRLLKLHSSILVTSLMAHTYWSGKSLVESFPGYEPFWELLLKPPVKVIKKIE